jgi:ketosteroid isomerase-like protein
VLSLSGWAEPSQSQTADEVIAVTKAQWAAEMKKDMATASKNIAAEYTEFSGEYPTRLDGKAITGRLAEAQAGGSGSLVAAEMANEKVQVYGDVAILTYNFIGATKDKDGKVEPQLAKSTRVYVKQGGQWMLVHANFAPVN